MVKLTNPTAFRSGASAGASEDAEDIEFRQKLVKAGVSFVKPTRTLRGENTLPNFPAISGGVVTPDLRKVKRAGFYVKLTENITLAIPLGGWTGAHVIFVLQQDGTGSRTLTLGSGFVVGDAWTAISGTAQAVNVLEAYFTTPTSAIINRAGFYVPAGPLHE